MAYRPLRYYLYDGEVARIVTKTDGQRASTQVWDAASSSWAFDYDVGVKELDFKADVLSEEEVVERLSTEAMLDEAPHRLDRVRELLEAQGADAVVLSAMPDVRWACGFTGSNGMLLVRADGEAHFLTDGRYRDQAADEVEATRVHVTRNDLVEHIEKEYLLRNDERVLFQSDAVTVDKLGQWKEQLERVTWVPVSGFLNEVVAKKDEYEVGKMRAAQRITEEVFEYLNNLVWRGLTEKDLAAEIVHQHLRRGAERMAFDPIVASGPNGALPHARPTDRRLQKGDLVVVDMGGVVNGYASDMTRVVAVGEPGEEARAVHALVRKAQEAALEAARPGIESKELDRAARDVIEEAGYGNEFSHSLGHGLGLRTHEWPSVSYRREYPLPEGAAVTIEPGVYLPNRFGVRIEDTVILRKGGAENLTRTSKELVVC